MGTNRRQVSLELETDYYSCAHIHPSSKHGNVINLIRTIVLTSTYATRVLLLEKFGVALLITLCSRLVCFG